MRTTTFQELRGMEACVSGYRRLARNLGGVRKYGQYTPITLLQILDSNGLDDALWAFDRLGSESERMSLACDYAEHVERIGNDPRVAECNRVTRRYIAGAATRDELAAALATVSAVWTPAGTAAIAAVWSAAAARAAEWAASLAWAGDNERIWQEARLREVLEADHGD